MSNTFQKQVASVVEMMAKAVLAEIGKVGVECSATLRFEMSHCREDEAPKVELPTMESEARMTQLASLIEILAQEAVNKICTLASEESAVLRLEVSQSQDEIRALERKVELMEKELRTAQGGGAGERPASTLSVGVQAESEFRAAAREEAHSAPVRLWGEAHSAPVRLWGDAGLEEEVSSLQCVVVMTEPSDVEDRIESIIIKEEGLEEDFESSHLGGGLDLSEQGAVRLSAEVGDDPHTEHRPYERSDPFCGSTDGQDRLTTSEEGRVAFGADATETPPIAPQNHVEEEPSNADAKDRKLNVLGGTGDGQGFTSGVRCLEFREDGWKGRIGSARAPFIKAH
ncbi:hypothetical protein AAFF_G00037590 [Aldrovandia affinis]|uniref:Uncharacterized protein n=1 Tax=Aldrovandia affinis TaxID=143900 RepID=A0AAD7T4Z8_9TELE|nr:hypothetical protein AAFF_G00037590 [Aldrovandia affinis]